MKITAICSSPREGATLSVIENLLNIIKSRAPDIETELIILANRNIRFCDGEQMCLTGECLVDDDMEEVLETIIGSDALILGSPTYFDNVNAIMKNFMDRTNPLTKGMVLEGRYAALIALGSEKIGSVQKTLDCMRSFISAHNMEEKGYLAALSNSVGTEVILNEIAKIAEELIVSVSRTEK